MRFHTVADAENWGKCGWAKYYDRQEALIERDLEILRDPDIPRHAKSRLDALQDLRLIRATEPGGADRIRQVKVRVGFRPRKFIVGRHPAAAAPATAPKPRGVTMVPRAMPPGMAKRRKVMALD